MLFSEPIDNTWTRSRTDSTSLWLRSEKSNYTSVARERINQWYEKFPDADGKTARKLLSNDDTQFFQALDEIYTHTLLLERWQRVEVELGSSTKPDFTCFDKDKVACIIEVASLFEPEDWRSTRKLYDQFADEIDNQIKPIQGYYLGFRLDNPKKTPPIRKFMPWLKRTLSSLPSPSSNGGAWIEMRFEDDEFGGLTTIFVPLRAGTDISQMRMVGMGPQIGGMVQTDYRLRDRIDKKLPSKYSVPENVPYLVATSIRGFIVERDSPKYAFYGSLQMFIPSGETKIGNDGLFGFDKDSTKGKRERLSAIGVIQNFVPWSKRLPFLDVFHNPLSKNPWSYDYLPSSGHFGTLDQNENSIQLGWIQREKRTL
jgi:hypothetical protein